jgi:two-component system, OmpR family, heavy metal sensor histidine kinase CusS
MPSRAVKGIPWNTLRVRLTVWNSAVVLLVTLAAFAAVSVGARAALYREADAVLRGEVRETAIALKDLSPDTGAVIAELRRKAAGHEERGWFTQLLEAEGATLWRSESCPDEIATFLPVRIDEDDIVVQVGHYRYARRRILDALGRVFHVRIGMSTAPLDDNVARLLRQFLPVSGLLVLLTPLVGYWLALQATTPVADVLRTADQLEPTRLGDRLPVRGTNDELDRLAITINRLLDQVASYVARQQQFVTDAAHELRGPLAAMQSSLEVAISQDRAIGDYRDTIAEVLDESLHLSKLTNDLLLLAETGDEEAATAREPVDVGAVVRQTAAMFGGVAEERSVRLSLEVRDGLAKASADPMQLRRVFGNLLDNALRFTPAGGEVVVTVRPDDGERSALVTVADTGSGIEPGHLPHVFDRFYKADTSRTHATTARAGGLGLAICRSIVERHGGRITVTSRPGGGTTFAVRLPLTA